LVKTEKESEIVIKTAVRSSKIDAKLEFTLFNNRKSTKFCIKINFN